MRTRPRHTVATTEHGGASVLDRRFAVQRLLAVSVIAMAVLLTFPGTAAAQYTTYSYEGDDYINTCRSARYTCDSGQSRAAEARITARRWPGNTYLGMAAKVEFHPYGEHIYVHDNYANGRYAWAHVQRRANATHGWGSGYKIRSSYYTHRNFNWPENHYVRVRVCEGTSTDYNQYGCTGWFVGRS